jgi:hypothetical protein
MGTETAAEGTETTAANDRPDDGCECGGGGGPSTGETVYILGFIGALVWFWRRSDGMGGRALAVGKAIVWPAILVYRAFAALDR